MGWDRFQVRDNFLPTARQANFLNVAYYILYPGEREKDPEIHFNDSIMALDSNTKISKEKG